VVIVHLIKKFKILLWIDIHGASMIQFERTITKSGTLYIVTIPRNVVRINDVKKGDRVFIAIKFEDFVLWMGIKKIINSFKNELAIALPNGKSYKAIWEILYKNKAPLTIYIFNIDEIEKINQFIDLEHLEQRT